MHRILLVEDNDMNRDMLSRRLARKGYRVDVAIDGEQALVQAASRPDIILLDMSLPVIDGWTVAGRLKSDPELQGIPVIALTAHAMVGDRERAMGAGCDDYQTKPVDFKALLTSIERLLDR